MAVLCAAGAGAGGATHAGSSRAHAPAALPPASAAAAAGAGDMLAWSDAARRARARVAAAQTAFDKAEGKLQQARADYNLVLASKPAAGCKRTRADAGV